MGILKKAYPGDTIYYGTESMVPNGATVAFKIRSFFKSWMMTLDLL